MTLTVLPFHAVCFDCDSTLSRIEGIDELALRRGVLDEIAPLTTAAMEGTIPLDEIYGKRLALVRPGKGDINWLAQRYSDERVEGAVKTISSLKRLNKSIHIISGGIRQAILPLAKELHIPLSNVHAVDISFSNDGSYEDYDKSNPLITPLGKADVVRDIIVHNGATAMVGDGLTDLAAREAGAYVIGFGGIARRQAVVDGADIFIDVPDLSATLPYLLNQEEQASLTSNRHENI